MATAIKMGEYRDTFLYRELDGSVWASGRDEGLALYIEESNDCTCLVDTEAGDTVEGFITALRAACSDTEARLVAALQYYVDASGFEDPLTIPEYAVLVEAFEAFKAERYECDGEDDDADGE